MSTWGSGQGEPSPGSRQRTAALAPQWMMVYHHMVYQVPACRHGESGEGAPPPGSQRRTFMKQHMRRWCTTTGTDGAPPHGKSTDQADVHGQTYARRVYRSMLENDRSHSKRPTGGLTCMTSQAVRATWLMLGSTRCTPPGRAAPPPTAGFPEASPRLGPARGKGREGEEGRGEGEEAPGLEGCHLAHAGREGWSSQASLLQCHGLDTYLEVGYSTPGGRVHTEYREQYKSGVQYRVQKK